MTRNSMMRRCAPLTALTALLLGLTGCDGETSERGPLSRCEALGCPEHGLCDPPSDEAEPGCLEACEPGWVWAATTRACALAPPNCEEGWPTSVLAECRAQRRLCVSYPGGARCGDCVAGFGVGPEGACVEGAGCDEAGCEGQGRVCGEGPPLACGGCRPGLVEQDHGGACRPPRRCEDLDCADLGCVEDPAGGDARCGEPCEGRTLYNGQRCVPCPPCDDAAAGEDGPEDRPTQAGACICRTAPGFFYAEANELGVVPCDADGDGWVRDSARVALESGDPVLVDNVRCALRTIDRIVLHNEEGQRRTVELEDDVPLFETVRNDDDRVLEIYWDRAQLPRDYWGEDGQGVRARALNRFTKLCHHPRVDYNDNGLPDAYEWAGAELPGDDPAAFEALSDYSYFLELHRGWFEPGAGGDDTPGAWHIAERSRSAGDGAVPLHYPADEGCPEELQGCTHWRECRRLRDPAADDLEVAVGMDLATQATDEAALPSGPDWRGMTHHSQFKCVVVTDTPSREQPLEHSPARAHRDFQLNACATAGPPSDDPQDRALQLACEPLEEAPQPGQAYWGLVPYQRYPASATHVGYAGGCTNGCAEALAAHAVDPAELACPGLPDNVPLCRGESLDWGRLVCLEVMCDEIDNDGDSEVDEDAPDPGLRCLTGEEASCCFTGQPGRCNLGTVTGCDGTSLRCEPTQPSHEICDGADNDCDEELDEDLDGVPCAAASPALGLPADHTLEGVCGDRLTVCLAGQPECLPRHLDAYQPEGETLCDGLDNDCDGWTDEELIGLPTGGAQPGFFGAPCVGEGAMGLCVDSVWVCEDGAPVCAATDERIVEVEACTVTDSSCHWLCDGLDNDCDGQVDEGDVCLRRWWTNLTLQPVATQGHTLASPGSTAEVRVRLELSGAIGSSELSARASMSYQERCDGTCWSAACGDGGHGQIPGTLMSTRCPVPPVAGVGEATAQTTIRATFRDFAGGDTAEVFYVDTDAGQDNLVDWGEITAEPNVTWSARHPAIIDLSCGSTLSGLQQAEPRFPECDRYLCVGHYEGCHGDQGCSPALSCAEGCDRNDWSCGGTCPMPGGVSEQRLGLTAGCCHEYHATSEATCWLRLGVDYRIWPLANLCGAQPSQEECDGCDNNHDGAVDESFPEDGQVCGVDVGACQPGTMACVAGGLVCQGGIEPQPEPDVCDGWDDDCDGETDEGVSEPCLSRCGPGTRACGSPVCLAGDCPEFCGTPGYRVCDEDVRVYGPCFWPEVPQETCNGEDDDCDGETDEGFVGDGEPCGSDVGLCVAGRKTCVGGELVCAGEVGPTDEVCDGADNDCDGPADEAEETGGCPCPEAEAEEACGDDEGECQPGARVCDGVVWSDCAGAVLPTAEVCDGLDNDCDGHTDEAVLAGPAELSQPCGADRGECLPGVWVCREGAPVCEGAVGPGAEVCDGLDNDCDGHTDLGHDEAGQPLDCGSGSSCGSPDWDTEGDTTDGFSVLDPPCAPVRGGRERVHHFEGARRGEHITVRLHAHGGWSPVLDVRQGRCLDGTPVGCSRRCEGEPGQACLLNVELPANGDIFVFVDGASPEDFGPYTLELRYGP